VIRRPLSGPRRLPWRRPTSGSITSGADAAGVLSPRRWRTGRQPHAGSGLVGASSTATGRGGDSLVIGEGDAAKFYTGQGFRIDSASEAGTRWDYNLTGFRGEEEIGFNAQPAVYTGAFQRLIDTKA
jgi:hypothetical protein